jgi:hypothetical protein
MNVSDEFEVVQLPHTQLLTISPFCGREIKIMKSLVAILIGFLVLAPPSVLGFDSNAGKRKPVLVDGDYNYPPFEFLDKSSRPAGNTADKLSGGSAGQRSYTSGGRYNA